MDTQSYTTESTNLFSIPSRIIIAGFSNSGKSQLTTKLIEKYHESFDVILYCGSTTHPLQSHKDINSKLILSSKIENPIEYSEHLEKGVLYILDDLFTEAVESNIVTQAFTRGRHNKISVIFISQNLFYSGKFARNIALNASHFILMKNRDMSQIENLGRQIFGKSHSHDLLEVYKRALTYNKFGYLLIDLSVNTPQELQLRTNIVGETDYQIVFNF